MTEPMWVDRIPVSSVLAARLAVPGLPTATASRGTTYRYWSTPPRPATDPVRDVLQIDFNDQRLINYIGVELASFPHRATLEHQDPDTKVWYPLLASGSSVASQIGYRVTSSVPARVDVASARGAEHPQHYGAGHWVYVSWRCRPVVSRAVRLVLQRIPDGTPPVDYQGAQVPYSLGARNFQIGYRINSLADVPRYGDVVTGATDFASTVDLLGSRVSLGLRRDAAALALTPGEDYWRCAPQPVSYAVVSYYADTRAADGTGQVIDRWYLDPLTVGPHLNLYYSSDEPTGAFVAQDTGLGYPIAQAHGTSATPHHLPPQPTADYLGFSHVYPSYVDVDNAYLQFDPRVGSWWIGLEVMSLFWGANGVPPDIPDQDPHHPLLSFGGCVLRAGAGVLEFSNDHGQVASVPLDPEQGLGSIWRVAAVFNPTDTTDYPAGLTLLYRLGDRPTVAETWAMDAPLGRPTVLRLGGYPDTGDPGVPGVALRALVLKIQPAGSDVADFLDGAVRFVHRPPFVADDDGSTDGSILRLDPSRTDPATSPFGLFGGPGDRYADLRWTPVARDYALKRGFLHLPPTKARYWKFEFTGLVAEPREVFVPIGHSVQVFSTDTVRHFAAVAQFSSDPRDGGPGAGALLELDQVNRYADALAVLRTLPVGDRHTATEVLYAASIADADRLRSAGWVWGFTPWHIGSTAPQFVTRTKHIYETIQVQVRSKIAFFAGLKAIRAYRLDHLADDDTPLYLDHLDDDQWLDTLEGVVLADGGLLSLTGRGEVVSKPMSSRSSITAIQFATCQSDAAQVLPDDDFLDPDFEAHWEPYGDATLATSPGRAVVDRGWRARSYADLEADPWGTYGGIETHLYGELEGAQPDGVAGGGVRSMPVDASGSGRLYAAIRASSAGGLSQPVVVQILAEQGDLVLASAQLDLSAGEEGTAVVGYTPGSASVPLTYAALEGQTYGSLEASVPPSPAPVVVHSYGSYESVVVDGPVYVRAAQLGPTHDSFTVTRLSLFDAPVQWAFSVDDGTTWYDSFEVRNDPQGVLSLPMSGIALRWRCRTYRSGTRISALAIRPWYAGLLGSAHHHGGSVSGPNRSVVDQLPPIESDPMWQQWHSPVPRWWYDAPTAPG